MRRLDLPLMVMSVILFASFACARQADEAGDGTGTEAGTDTGTETETETGDEPLECANDMRCNPLDLEDCPEGDMCIYFSTEFQCFPFMGDGSGVAGAPCEAANDCNPGLACIQSVFFPDCAGAACCSPNCDVDGPNICAAGEICDPWMLGDDADPCYVDVGVCITEP
jgi:hypothetical protein